MHIQFKSYLYYHLISHSEEEVHNNSDENLRKEKIIYHLFFFLMLNVVFRLCCKHDALVILVMDFFSESSSQEQTKSLDANSSKDLKALLSHSDDESGATTTAKPVTNYSLQNTSKELSKSKAAVTRPSSAANTVRLSSLTPMTQNEAVQNQSFLQASLGQITPSEPQQSQLSSVIGDITPQNTSLTPPHDGQSNVTENVSYVIFLRTFLCYYGTY